MCFGSIAAAINKKKPKTVQPQDAKMASAKKAILAETARANPAKKIARPVPKIAVAKTTRSATTASAKNSIPAEMVLVRPTKAKIAPSVRVIAPVQVVCCAIVGSAKNKNLVATENAKAIKKKIA
jgi:hypothetical protein